jgi:hypothetical protein
MLAQYSTPAAANKRKEVVALLLLLLRRHGIRDRPSTPSCPSPKQRNARVLAPMGYLTAYSRKKDTHAREPTPVN